MDSVQVLKQMFSLHYRLVCPLKLLPTFFGRVAMHLYLDKLV